MLLWFLIDDRIKECAIDDTITELQLHINLILKNLNGQVVGGLFDRFFKKGQLHRNLPLQFELLIVFYLQSYWWRKESIFWKIPKERSVYNLESNIFIYYFFNVTIISPTTLHRLTEGSKLCFRTGTEVFHVQDYSRLSHRTWMCTKVTSSSEKETRIN